MSCDAQKKGHDNPCPYGMAHKCKETIAHSTTDHECRCGYVWDNPNKVVAERTGVNDFVTGEASESPFDPQFDWLVLMMEDSRGKKGSLYIPDTAKDAPQVGRVLAAGPGIFAMDADERIYCTTPMLFKVGDRVLFAKYSGADIEWTDDKTYLFVKQSDIICKVK